MNEAPLLLAVLSLLSLSPAFADDIKAWPLFYQDTDPVTHTARTEIGWPLFVRETTPEYSATQFLSFPQTFPTHYPHQFYFLWPLSGVRAGNGHDTWLFPLLWSGSEKDRNDHYFALFPAFYYGEDGDETTFNLALLQHNHWDKNGSGHYLFPLFWNSRNTRDDYRDHSFGLLPLIWLNRNQSTGVTYRYRSHSGGALLLSWWGHRATTNTTTTGMTVSDSASANLFPLFHRGHSTATTSGILAPGRNADDSLWVIPYWQSHESWSNNTVVVSKSRHRLFPLYWDWNDTKGQTVDAGTTLFPLWWHSAIREAGELTESANFLVPIGAHFYKKGAYDTQNLLGPIFNRTENTLTKTTRYDALFPLFSLTHGETESGGHIFPLAGWSTAKGRHENLWYGCLLGWNCESQEDFNYRMSRPQFFALHELETRPAVAETDCRNGPRRTVAFYPFFWSKRQADEQNQGLLPFYWKNTSRYGRSLSQETVIPLLLGDRTTMTRDDIPFYSHQNYLLSLIANGRGEHYRESRVFPFFSYNRTGSSRSYSSFLLPFSYESWKDPKQPDRAYSSGLSIPFDFLQIYHSEARHSDSAGTTQKSWFFPFYQRENISTPDEDSSKLSILWPFWNGEWVNGETHIRGLGGAVNYFEKDAGGFIEQRLLYRVFTRKTRSWFNQHELMPFYAQSAREDGQSSWGILGGLIGGGSDGARNYLRLLYMKIPTSQVTPLSIDTLAAQHKRHANLGLDYLQHGRHDRAAVEFTLAGHAGAGDAGFQLAAGEAYLKAEPDALGKELRSTIPKSLDPIYGKSGTENNAAILKNLRTQAVQCFENAIRLDADKPVTLRKLAAALNELGRRPEALQRLTDSDRLHPSFTTGMLRWETATTIWSESFNQASSNAPVCQAARATVRTLLAELKTRYPQSPSLAIEEGNLILRGGNPNRYLGYGDSAYGWMDATAAFSKETRERLELYQQGAEWTPGMEEQAWLNSRPKRPAFFPCSWSCGPDATAPTPPSLQCARWAASILNQQMSTLIDQKKYDAAAALQLPLFRLLPRTCIQCARPDVGETRIYYDDPTSVALQNLYRLTITVSNHPLEYIATAEGLAPNLCRHRQTVIKNALESVRLEQQYIKIWHIAGTIAGKAVTLDYTGKFFERYVNLDSLLGQPDHCTVTAECGLNSPDERKAVLRLGFDHTLTAELNGQIVFGPKSRKIAVRDEYKVPVTLKAGANQLKLTVTDDTLAYGFFSRLSDERGELMRDITVK